MKEGKEKEENKDSCKILILLMKTFSICGNKEQNKVKKNPEVQVKNVKMKTMTLGRKMKMLWDLMGRILTYLLLYNLKIFYLVLKCRI